MVVSSSDNISSTSVLSNVCMQKEERAKRKNREKELCVER